MFMNVSVHAYYQNFEPQSTGLSECRLRYSLMKEAPGKVNVWTRLDCKRKTKQETKIWKLTVLYSWGL